MAQGITFFEEYFNFMDDMTPEQFYEFMGLIRDLRFNDIDTKPEEIEDKDIRLAWRSVRPSVAKSTLNAKDYERKRKEKEEQAKKDQSKEEQQVSTFTVPTNTGKTQQYNEITNLDNWALHFHKLNEAKGQLEMETKMKDICEVNNYDFNKMRAAYYSTYPPKQNKEVVYA